MEEAYGCPKVHDSSCKPWSVRFCNNKILLKQALLLRPRDHRQHLSTHYKTTGDVLQEIQTSLQSRCLFAVSLCLSVCLSLSLSVCLSACLSVPPSVRAFVCGSVLSSVTSVRLAVQKLQKQSKQTQCVKALTATATATIRQ